ncbi:MAG: hypothetical protein ACR2P0_00655 [Acidimicrobiales bacterium]
MMLAVIVELAKRLNDSDVQYCHWKSNWALADSVLGDADLDVLVHRDDAAEFRRIVGELGFTSVVDAANAPFPAVEHFYALDDVTGQIAHVHSYYRIISGQSLVKNYWLPVEDMLLADTREAEASLRVPSKSAELILFTIRMLLKHTSPLELVLVMRDFSKVVDEAEWLLDEGVVDEARDLVDEWLPQLGADTLDKGVVALSEPHGILRRIALGHVVKRRLRGNARSSTARILGIETRKFFDLLFHRARGSKKGLTSLRGGAVIAFVGSEASGKSTLIDEVGTWLGKNYTVDRIHVGKPPGRLLTRIPNAVVPLMRRLAPSRRSTVVEKDVTEGGSGSTSLIFALRSLSLAYDRRALLLGAHRHAANGRVVLCDRYPSVAGQVDSAQLGHLLDDSPDISDFVRRIARLEARMYAQVPPPNLIVRLSASLETTLARNAARSKTEPEDYVARRHERSLAMRFENAEVVSVSTDGDIEETFEEIKRVVWRSL